MEIHIFIDFPVQFAMAFAVDDLGFLLSVAETMLLLIGLFFYVWATYAICSDTLLHANFRLRSEKIFGESFKSFLGWFSA